MVGGIHTLHDWGGEAAVVAGTGGVGANENGAGVGVEDDVRGAAGVVRDLERSEGVSETARCASPGVCVSALVDAVVGVRCCQRSSERRMYCSTVDSPACEEGVVRFPSVAFGRGLFTYATRRATVRGVPVAGDGGDPAGAADFFLGWGFVAGFRLSKNCTKALRWLWLRLGTNRAGEKRRVGSDPLRGKDKAILFLGCRATGAR